MVGYATGPHGGESSTRRFLLETAQVEATLLLVEEQRTANLLALWQAEGGFTDASSAEILDQILRRLGLRS